MSLRLGGNESCERREGGREAKTGILWNFLAKKKERIAGTMDTYMDTKKKEATASTP